MSLFDLFISLHILSACSVFLPSSLIALSTNAPHRHPHPLSSSYFFNFYFSCRCCFCSTFAFVLVGMVMFLFIYCCCYVCYGSKYFYHSFSLCFMDFYTITALFTFRLEKLSNLVHLDWAVRALQWVWFSVHQKNSTWKHNTQTKNNNYNSKNEWKKNKIERKRKEKLNLKSSLGVYYSLTKHFLSNYCYRFWCCWMQIMVSTETVCQSLSKYGWKKRRVQEEHEW